MKIRILTSCTGNNFSYGANQIVNAKKDVAEDLVESNYAEYLSKNENDEIQEDPKDIETKDDEVQEDSEANETKDENPQKISKKRKSKNKE